MCASLGYRGKNQCGLLQRDSHLVPASVWTLRLDRLHSYSFPRKRKEKKKNVIMNSPRALFLCLLLASVALVTSFRSNQEDSLTNAYLRDWIRQWDAGNGDSYSADNDVDSFDDFAIRADDSDEGYEENKALDLLQQRLQRPSLSLRDQEYLQHSSLFSKTPSEKDEDANGLKNLATQSANKIAAALSGKTSGAVLPAYCNPPNPCPVGYTAEDGCLEDFENTAAFSRAYQAAQDCMCDMEHMFDCPEPRGKNDNGSKQGASANMVNTAIRKIVSEMQQGLHKSLVSKKFHTNQLYDVDMDHLKEQAIDTVMSASNPVASDNPYLQGERLPIAAKKGGMISADK